VGTYGGGLEFTALEDLDHDSVLVGCAEFVLESTLASGVENTLGSVAVGWDVNYCNGAWDTQSRAYE
jgi:hypothetical protein